MYTQNAMAVMRRRYLHKKGNKVEYVQGKTDSGRHRFVEVECEFCKQPYPAMAYRIERGIGKFCSRKCSGANLNTVIMQQTFIGDMRKCLKCGEIKPVKAFNIEKRNKSNHTTYCKRCDCKSRSKLKIEVLTHYSPELKCDCCGEGGVEFLALDHIDGGGNKHRKEVTGGVGGPKFYRWVKSQGFPSGYRVLCHNCNFAYGVYGECPHQLRGSTTNVYC